MARLNQRVWKNPNLTEKTIICIYHACVLSTLLYSSEAWTNYASQEVKLNSFHLRCLRRILRIQWQDKVPNTEVLERTGMNSMFSILSERHLRWLGHVRRMDPGRIPKDLLYDELAEGARLTGRPRLRYKDVCKKDMKWPTSM
ncbi:NLR family CARD domain-containing protein 3-like [Tachysurus ichikawai]